MRVLVYPEVLHGGQVHSLAIDISNSKLATSGKDGNILIWNVDELIGLNTVDKDNLKEAIDRFDYSMKFEYHKSLVNNLKWSPKDANQFISSDSDGNIYINDLLKSPKLLFPYNESQSRSGVVDLSWSPDGRLVCWSSLDAKVHVYDLKHETYQELTSLLHLEKPVVQRSICFDPTNRYLLSLGDDTVVHIYEFQYDSTTNNYQFRVVNKITKLINPSNINFHYSRVSWSPDGEFISIPSSKKNQTTLITILSKSNDWSNSFNLVGHGISCEVVRYNPLLFEKNDNNDNTTTTNNNNNPQTNGAPNDSNQNGKSTTPVLNKTGQNQLAYSNVIATAGSDKTLALWNTSKDTPLLVLEKLVDDAIVDLCWNQSGNSLFLASLDGHLAIVTFNDKEIGIASSTVNKEDVIKQAQDNTHPFNSKNEVVSSGSKLKTSVIEILDGKDAVSIHEVVPDSSSTTPAIKEQSDKDPSVNLSSAKQNTPIVDNKPKDFVPEVVSAPDMHDPDAVDDILSSAMDNVQPKGKNSGAIKENGFANGITKSPSKKASSSSSNSSNLAPVVNALQVSKQKTTTKDGKKRIQPMLVSNGGLNGSANDMANRFNQNLPTKQVSKSDGSRMMMELDKPSYNVSEGLFKHVKRQKLNDDSSNKKAKRELEPAKFIGSVIVNPNITFAKTRLATPKVRLNFQLTSTVESDESFVLDIKNGSGNDAKPSRITYYKKEKQIWCDFVPRLIQLCTEGRSFWAACTNDGQIYTYSHTSGRRILPPIVLGSPLSFLESHGDFLMAITCVGELYVWDINLKKLHLNSPLSISTLLDANTKYQDEGLSKSERITLCSITSLGIPLVTLSNGSGYLFNKDLGVWQTITESWWAFGSHYWDSLGDGQNGKSQSSSLFGNNDDDSSIVGLLENKTNEEIIKNTRAGRGKFFNKISKNMLMKEGFENLENTISISHLENRLLCCELLGEKKDFHGFFMTYVKRVCELGLKAKVFEICSQLLGPSDDDEDYDDDDDDSDKAEKDGKNNKSSWDPKICDLDKHELLKEVILNCSDLRDSQRILTHFAKKVGLL